MITVNYVSSVAVNESALGAAINDIQSVSVSRNSFLSVTGLLIVSPSYFSQVLEGLEEDVGAVMASIERDRRHRDIVIFRREKMKARQFETWQMVLYDSVSFGVTTVDPLLASVHQQKDPQAIKRYDRFIRAVATNGAVTKR